MNKLIAKLFLLCLLVPCAWAAEPVTTAWIVNPATSANPQLARVQPEVRAVNVHERYVEIQSGGLSLYNLGPLQTPAEHVERLRALNFRIPRFPAPAKPTLGKSDAHPSVRPDVLGVFVSGVPIYNRFEAASYQGQNLWHFDPIAGGDDGNRVANGYSRDTTHSLDLGMLENLLADGTRHSPLLGFAFDGYPVYGPWGYVNGETKSLRRLRSGYRLRRIERRTAWADGTQLTPGQYGPPVNADFPLGTFIEDYEYVAGAGDLDEFNGRFAVTPEYPAGTYAYFLTTDAQGRLAYPYLLARRYYGQVTVAELQAAFRDDAAAQPCLVTGRELLAVKRTALELNVSGEALAAGQSLRLSFAARQPNGTPVRALEYVHERPLHLLVVSAGLVEFEHIHPSLVAGDRYELTHTFKHGGRYRLYADFTAPGATQRVESFDLTLNGPRRHSVPLRADAVWQKERDGLQLGLAAAQSLRAGEDIELTLAIRDAKTGQPASDLEPFLGAWAHFVIIDERQTSFLHAHPLEAPQAEPSAPPAHVHSATTPGPPPAVIRTLTSFPRPGLYKLWAQFQRGGQVITQPFVLQVGEARPPAAAAIATTIPTNAVRLEIGPEGYKPAKLTLAAGQPTTLAITTRQRPSCASRIVFPSLGLTHELPLNGTVLLKLPALPVGELSFGCGMGMFKGALIVQ